MRTFALPLSALLCLVSCLTVQAQNAPAGMSTDIYIPSVLQKGIRAEKARPGDKVSFALLEAILIGKGIVIPANAHLFGHVVEARAATASSESRLSVEVDRAEWRHHDLPLHAFIHGLGVREVHYEATRSDCDSTGIGPDVPEPEIPQPGFARAQGEPACDMPWDLDDRTIGLTNRSELVHLQRETNNRDGSTTLTSRLKNIHLSAGVLIMLHNVPLQSASRSTEVAARGQ